MTTPEIISAGGAFWRALANHLWQSTAFVYLTWLFMLPLRHNQARIRYRLWLIASVKFLLPFALLIKLGSCLPGFENHSSRPPTSMYYMVDVASRPFSERVAPALVNQTVRVPDLKQRMLTTVPLVLALLWSIGSIAVCVFWFVRWRQIAAIRERAVPIANGREVETLRKVEEQSEVPIGVDLLRSSEVLEPGVYGAFRPVLLWPDRLSQHLQDEHIEAIIEHELMHVRRRDNLTATIHMLVAAIFWFHPLVWWIEKRLLDERERACDEAVVQRQGRPDVYAESLLAACRFCVETPLPCVAGIAGANLKDRIVGIMSTRSLKALDFKRKFLFTAIALLAVGGPILYGFIDAPSIEAQSNAQETMSPLPRFDVATIKPNKSHDSGERFGFPANGFTATNVPLTMLIKLAYGVDEDQVVGLTAQMKSQRYDIVAKAVGVDLKKFTLDQRKEMIGPLLKDRFGLSFHRDGKTLPVYVLSIAKNGPKFQESQPEGSGPLPEGHRRLRMLDRGNVQGLGVPMDVMAQMMTDMLGRTVVDNTGLKGVYDFTLKWTPDQGSGAGPDAGNGQPNTTSDSSAPSFFTAVSEQLGLKLKVQSSPVGVIVIDHVDQPTPN
jgi:bla regulator protein BlaR1